MKTVKAMTSDPRILFHETERTTSTLSKHEQLERQLTIHRSMQQTDLISNLKIDPMQKLSQ